MSDKAMTPVQPHENNGGTPVSINSSTDNKTKPFPNTKPKSEEGWKGYGVNPKR